MNAKVLVLGLAVALTGCATTSSEVGVADGFTIVRQAVRAHLRADREALRSTAALFRHHRGNVIEGRTAEREAAALRSESGFDPTLTMQPPSYRDERGRPSEAPVMQSIEMEVGLAEMLTPEGTLHPRAARALARMDNMAREHGGDFSVTVPRSQIRTAAAIKAVAPGATIVATDEDEHYRLIVFAAEP